jgi:S-adenosylmethionine:diacylglycerol 3-amino-3-carboxypropyl transferase
MLLRMRPEPVHHDREEQALDIYRDIPLEDGDAVLLLDQQVCLEMEQLAALWDEQIRRNLVHVLIRTAARVLVAVARDGEVLQPGDYQLWRDLHAGLRDADVELLPIRALPAA